jgi:hypothetical protein
LGLFEGAIAEGKQLREGLTKTHNLRFYSKSGVSEELEGKQNQSQRHAGKA